MPLRLARAFDLWILFSAIGFFLTILYHPHKRWWANVNARNWIVETEGASVGFRGANSEWGTLETFLANWVCSEPAIQAPGFGQCPGRRKVSTTTLIHDEVVKYEFWNRQVSTTTLVHDEVGKCEIAIGQRVARGWGAIANSQKKTCDTWYLIPQFCHLKLQVCWKWSSSEWHWSARPDM